MIEQLNGHITRKQIDEICDTITSQYRRFLRYSNMDEYQSLFAPEYASHRQQHQLAHAIMSAFPVSSIIAGFTVDCYKDGGGHARPLLRGPNLIIHVQSESFNRKSSYLREFYHYNEDSFSGETLYCYIVFKEKDNQLINITINLPDVNGRVVQNEVLVDQDRIKALIA